MVGSNATLGEIYGPQFEAALIKLMLSDERFASYAGAHLDEEMFLKTHYKEIASAFSHIFKASGNKPPSEASVEAELNLRRAKLNGNGGSRTFRIEKAISRISALKKKRLTVADEEHIKRNLQGYVLNRRALNAITDAIDLVESQDFDKIPMMMSETIQSAKLFAESDAGFNFSDIKTRLSAYHQKDKHVLRSPIGLPRIDKMIRGGLEPGKLGVIVAPPGTGKTMTLIMVGAKAVAKGMNVVHISLEIDQAETSIRYDANMLQVPINELLRNPLEHRKRIKEIAEKTKGKLIIREWGPSEVSALDIRAYLKYLENVHKFVPDVILVDYADLLKSMRLRNSEITEIADTYRALRQIAKDLKCRVWSASQVNKMGMNNEVVTLQDMYGSGEKAAVPDIILGLCQTPIERRNGYMRIVNMKNRQGGREGTIIDCDVNTAVQSITESAVQRSKFKKNDEEDE